MHVYTLQLHDPAEQRTELTLFQKAQILEARALNNTYGKISKQLGIPRSTVSTFLQRSKQRESFENLPRPGRPRATSQEHDRYVIRTAEANTRIPFKELRDITNTDASVRTLQRRLLENHLRKWKATEHILLTSDHVKKQLNWARVHCEWTVDDWKHVI